MTKTKSIPKKIMLVVTAMTVVLSVLVSSISTATAAATFPFTVFKTTNFASTAEYDYYGLKEDVSIGSSGTVHGGNNWTVKSLKTKRGYEPVYCVEPSKSVADATYSESSIRYDAETHLKLGEVFLYCYTAAFDSTDKLKSELVDNHDNMCRYLATQIIVWEATSKTDLAYICGKFRSSVVSTNVRKYYDQYKKAIADHNKELDRKYFFSSAAEANKHIFKDETASSQTFTDANLKNFKVDSISNGKASISGNKLTVTAEPAKNALVRLVQTNVNDEGYRRGFLTYSDNVHQAVAVSKADPMDAYITVAGQATGKVAIIKKSSDGKVEGIKFTIQSKDGKYKNSAVTDKNGKLDFPDLKAGTYIVTEEMTSEMARQYNSTKSKTVVVKAGQTSAVTFVNTKYTGHISITKYSEDGNIQGVEMELSRYTLDKEGNMDNASFESVGTKLTDENGYAEWDNLDQYDNKGNEYLYWIAENHISEQYAKSKVKFYVGSYDEAKADDGQCDALTFELFGGENKNDIAVTAVNILKRSNIEIYKKDKETGQVIKKAGAEFQIYNANGELVTLSDKDGKTVSTFTTDKNGCAKLPEPLTYGEYTCVEVKAPNGFVIDKEPVKFAVTEDGATVKVEKKDSEQKGTIKLIKTGNIFKSVGMVGSATADESGKVIETPTEYSPIFEDGGLSGATFDIIAVSDIYYPNGEIRIKSGTVVDTIKTDKNGEAVSKELFLGDYKAVEKKAPKGYVLDKTEHLVSLTYAGQEVSITSAVTEAYNSYQKVDVSLKKIMESAPDYGIESADYRQYVTFGLFADEDITAADGKAIPKDGLIEQISLNENMTASFHKALPFGKYYVKEMTTDEHYIISDKKYKFKFTYKGDDVPTVKIQTDDFVNNLKRGSVKGIKVDTENNSPLANAVIGLFKGDEKKFEKNNAIVTTKSTKDGSFAFKAIPYGVYQIKEITAPTGYKLTDKVFPVTISENEQVVEIKIENEIIRGNVEVKKFDKDTDKKMSGAIFTLYKDSDSDGKYNATKDVSYGVLNEKDGIYSLNGIPYGDYLLAETKAPTCYVLDTHCYSVKIREDGRTITVSNDKSKDKFYNEKIKGSVKINKYDKGSNKKLSGAEFTVYKGNTSEVYGKLTEKNGVYSLSNIPYGKYSVKETKAPKGYELDKKKYSFEITKNGQTITISNSESKDRFDNVKITTTTTTSVTTTTTTTTSTTSSSDTTPKKTTSTTDVTTTTAESTTATSEVTTTNTNVTTTETTATETDVTTTEVSATETTVTSAPEVTTVSGTVPFRKEGAPKTGDARHGVAVVAAALGLLAFAGMIFTRKRMDR